MSVKGHSSNSISFQILCQADLKSEETIKCTMRFFYLMFRLLIIYLIITTFITEYKFIIK